jgi:hypothetical protein
MLQCDGGTPRATPLAQAGRRAPYRDGASFLQATNGKTNLQRYLKQNT